MALQKAGLVQHRDDEVAPFLEGLAALRDEVLRTGKRLDRRPLGDGTGARRLLALQHVHRLDERVGSRAVADAPAGHRVGFGHAIHRQCALVKLRLDLRRRREDEVAVDEVLVHIVGEYPDMRMLQKDISDFLQLRARIGSA